MLKCLKDLGEGGLGVLDGGIGIASSIPLQIYFSKVNHFHQLLLTGGCVSDYSFPQFFAICIWTSFCALLFRFLRLACWAKIKKEYYKSLRRQQEEEEEEQEANKEQKFVENLRGLVEGCLDMGIGFASSIPLQIYLGQFYSPDHDHHHHRPCSYDIQLEIFAILLWIVSFIVLYKCLYPRCCRRFFTIKGHYDCTKSLTTTTKKGAEEPPLMELF